MPLLGAVDLAMMGRLPNIAFAGAVSLGAMIFSFMYWAMGFLRIGTAGLTAQSFGKKRADECVYNLSRALLLAALGSALLIVFRNQILSGIYLYLKPNEELWQATIDYYQIRIWAAPATVSAFAFAGWFIGMQDTKTPMYVAIVVNLVNIFLNYIFVLKLGMNIKGVAYSTLLAQYIGMALYIVFVLRGLGRGLPRGWGREQELERGQKELRGSGLLRGLGQKENLRYIFSRKVFDKSSLLQFTSINKDAFIRTLLMILVFSFFTAQSSRYGNTILVTNTILYEFFIFFSYATDGFAHAAEALCGRFDGAGDVKRKRDCIRQIFRWGVVVCLVFVTAYAIFFKEILALFSNSAEVLAEASGYLPWVLAVTVIGFAAFLWDGIYVGCLQTKAMMYIVLLATIAYFASVFLFEPNFGNHALWLGLSLFLGFRSLVMTLCAKKLLFRK